MSPGGRESGFAANPAFRVPRLARLLVTGLVRDDSAEFIIGDLDEAYILEVDAGASRARLRYWRLALASIWSRWSGRRAMGPETGPGRAPGRGPWGAFANDSRFAFRLLRKSPAFAAVAIVTLALGIGANTAAFSVLNGVLLRPLPYEDADELVNVWQIFYEWQESDVEVFRQMAERFPVSHPTYQAWLERAHVFESLAAYSDFNTIVEGPDLAEWIPTVATTAQLFDVLGIDPQIGRGISANEDRVDGDRVVVLSHGFWTRRFGGDPGVLGETLTLTGVPHTIVGVMPVGFYFPERDHQLWVPLRDGTRNDRWTSQSLSVIARLRNGIPIEQAQAEMDAVTLQIFEDNPDIPDVGVRLAARIDEVAGSTRSTLLLLMSAVGLVLVVTSANIAALLLVWATGRRQELAIRQALGAGRGRLAGQLLTESAMLAIGGGVLGLAAATGGMRWLRLLLPDSIPRIEDIAVDWRVLGFSIAVTATIAAAFGLATALHAGRRSPLDALRIAGPGFVHGRHRGRSTLVVGEVMVAVVLLVAATLLLSSYLRLRSVDRGFDEENLLTMDVFVPLAAWENPQRVRAFYRDTLENVAAIPSVRSAAVVKILPFSGSQSSDSFALVENPQSGEDAGWSLEETVTHQYFETMGIPLLRGRLFARSDTSESERVVIINERLAAYYWPNEDPVGRTLWEGGEPFTIVGVVGNIKHRTLTEEIERKRYRLYEHDPDQNGAIVVRTSGNPVALVPAVRDAVRSVSPMATIATVATMSDLVAETTSLERFRTLMLSGLASIAVTLAVLGVYGVVAFSVAERRREIGVRMTLGAVRADILRQVLADGARLIVPGVALGLATAAGAARFIESYVYEVPTTDPLTFAGVALLVAVVALLATWIPARRATRIEPLIVLRGE